MVCVCVCVLCVCLYMYIYVYIQLYLCVSLGSLFFSSFPTVFYSSVFYFLLARRFDAGNRGSGPWPMTPGGGLASELASTISWSRFV